MLQRMSESSREILRKGRPEDGRAIQGGRRMEEGVIPKAKEPTYSYDGEGGHTGETPFANGITGQLRLV